MGQNREFLMIELLREQFLDQETTTQRKDQLVQLQLMGLGQAKGDIANPQRKSLLDLEPTRFHVEFRMYLHTYCLRGQKYSNTYELA